MRHEKGISSGTAQQSILPEHRQGSLGQSSVSVRKCRILFYLSCPAWRRKKKKKTKTALICLIMEASQFRKKRFR